MAKKKKDTNHMGKHTGYELVDGVYHIAPVYISQFGDLGAQRAGIEDMLAMVTRHAAKDLEVVARAYRKLWDDVAEDLGLDITSGEWGYYRNGTIKQKDSHKEAIGQ